MAREALEVCLSVLKESKKGRFDSSVGQAQCIEHIPYYLSGLSRAHFSRQPFSKYLYTDMFYIFFFRDAIRPQLEAKRRPGGY